jgi:hypothetical protein
LIPFQGVINADLQKAIKMREQSRSDGQFSLRIHKAILAAEKGIGWQSARRPTNAYHAGQGLKKIYEKVL